MIILLHPRSTRPKNRRFPLSVLAVGAVLEGKETYEIVDGNIDPRPMDTVDQIAREQPVEMLGVSVMPGPQMVQAIALSKEFRARYPKVPIVWGGYFPSLYPDAALNSSYVDVLVRSQGEDTLPELLGAMREGRDYRGIPGLSYKDQFGLHVHTADRPIKSPGDFPWMPYHRLREPAKYIARTFLGARTAVHHASYGCPYRCKFCGVTKVAHGRQKSEAPERTAAVLTHLQREYAIDAVQFYDNNFFLREADAVDLAVHAVRMRSRNVVLDDDFGAGVDALDAAHEAHRFTGVAVGFVRVPDHEGEFGNDPELPDARGDLQDLTGCQLLIHLAQQLIVARFRAQENHFAARTAERVHGVIGIAQQRIDASFAPPLELERSDSLGLYAWPYELEFAQKVLRPRRPKVESV